jgi:hypothetical protein
LAISFFLFLSFLGFQNYLFKEKFSYSFLKRGCPLFSQFRLSDKQVAGDGVV